MTRVPDKTKRAAEDLAKSIQEQIAIARRREYELEQKILVQDMLTINDKGEVFRIKRVNERWLKL